MIKPIDIVKATKRKKLWDLFGWNYGDGWLGYLRNTHSLKCSCKLCRLLVYEKRIKNKRERIKSRLEIKCYEE